MFRIILLFQTLDIATSELCQYYMYNYIYSHYGSESRDCENGCCSSDGYNVCCSNTTERTNEDVSGIVIGSVFGLTLFLTFIVCFCKKAFNPRQPKDILTNNRATAVHVTGTTDPSGHMEINRGNINDGFAAPVEGQTFHVNMGQYLNNRYNTGLSSLVEPVSESPPSYESVMNNQQMYSPTIT